jgi:outer membrane lipoprotein SlyB
MRSALRLLLPLTLASTLLSGCIVAPVGHYPRQPQQSGYPGGYPGGYPNPYPSAEPRWRSDYPQAPAEPSYGVSRYGDVRYGTIAGIEPMGSSRGSSSGAGAVTGGVIGGVIGHEIGRGMGGRRGDGGAVGAMLGAFGGAVIGDQIERDANRGGPAGWRLWIRMDGGGDQSLQVPDVGGLRVGERVRFVNGRLERLG